MVPGWLIGTQKYPSLLLLTIALLGFADPGTQVAEGGSEGNNAAEPRYRAGEKKNPQGNR